MSVSERRVVVGSVLGGLGIAVAVMVTVAFVVAVAIARSRTCDWSQQFDPPDEAWVTAGALSILVLSPVAIGLSGLGTWIVGRPWPLLALVLIVILWGLLALDILTGDSGQSFLFPPYCLE